jgi:hypothetical protein
MIEKGDNSVRRLNVRSVNLGASVQNSMFALHSKQKLDRGELLLLQLKKGDAKKEGTLRIEYVIVFDHFGEDIDGDISRKYWPNAGRTWKWIIYGSKTIKTKPFSLEDLPLSKGYDTEYPATRIDKKDESIILSYIYS